MFSNKLIFPDQVSDGVSSRRMSFLMNTWVRVEVSAAGEEAARHDVDAAFDRMRAVEVLLSRFIPESPVSRINREASHEAVPVPQELFDLVCRSVEISERTEGAFDVTMGELVDLWRQAERTQRLPDAHTVREIVDQIGWRFLALDGRRRTLRFLRPLVRLDLGAIGKGHALDRAAEVLKQRRVSSALLDAGGNLLSFGPKRLVGIRDPLQEGGIAHRLWLENEAVATSANDQRALRIEGKDHGHLLDPRTGSPVRNGILSVSVVAKSAALADALSTALFVLGPDGIPAAKSFGASRVVFIRRGRRWGRSRLYIEDQPV